MKILALSDVHSRVEKLKKLLEKAGNQEIDLILVAGDLSNFGGETQAKEVLDEIKKLNKKMFVIPGNLDSKEAILFLEKENVSLHGKKENYGKFVFVGFGGATECIGKVAYTEKEIYKKLKGLIEKEGKELNDKKEKVFLLTHAPPKNSSLDKSFSGKAIGSSAVRRIIEEFSPEFSLSGHCHEGIGKERIGKTFCINSGAVKEGKMTLIDTEKKEVKRFSL